MTFERMKTFSVSEQLLFVGSELERARVWQGSDTEKFKMALDRALELVVLMRDDPKWRENIAMLEYLENILYRFRTGAEKQSIKFLYNAL